MTQALELVIPRSKRSDFSGKLINAVSIVENVKLRSSFIGINNVCSFPSLILTFQGLEV